VPFLGAAFPSKLRGYDDKSLVSASVSKLARCLPMKEDGGDDDEELSTPFPESIWNGKDERPFEKVDDWDATDIPSALRFTGRGGGGSGAVASPATSSGGGSRLI